MYGIDTSKRYTDIFDMSRFFPYDEKAESYDVFNSKFLLELPNLPVAGEYIVQSELIAPDLISYNMFGNENLFWVVMFYNGLSNYQDIRSGTVLKFPSYQDIERLYFSLKGER